MKFCEYLEKAAQQFMTANGTPQDLMDRVLTNILEMEFQIMPAPDGWESIGHGRYSDGVRERGAVRSPRYVNGKPTFPDRNVTFDEAAHWLAIGFSGWNWKKRESCWIGFDVDSLTNHAAGVGISDEEMAKVIEQTQQLPYVETRRSTSSEGVHLYVMLDPIKTQNREEHAAVARRVLAKMSEAAGYDFTRSVDCFGRILWVGHRRRNPKNGFALIKPAERNLTEADLDGWRDHVDVVTGRRAKVSVRGVEPSHEDEFDLLTSSRPVFPLDDTHRAIIEKLREISPSTSYIQERHLIQTHTTAFQEVMDKYREELGLVGVFKTNSPGTDLNTPNCFAFAVPKGGFHIYRFSPGIVENPSWVQNGQEWTHCYFNQKSDLRSVALSHDGDAAPNGDMIFDTADGAAATIREFTTEEIALPEEFLNRKAQIKAAKKGEVTFLVKMRGDESRPSKGWVQVRGGWWARVFQIDANADAPIDQLSDFDNSVRRVRTPDRKVIGWWVRDDSGGGFHHTSLSEAKLYVIKDVSKAEAEVVIGKAVASPWIKVVLPFQPEYPGGRLWNMDAPQFRHQPKDPGDNPDPHPHWDMVLKHCFSDLDAAVKANPWAIENGIVMGAQYGLAWVSCCFRDPFEPLPFLFFYGNQNCGKSIFHEALSLLVTRGVVSAGRALKDKNGFNGELANAVVAYVEEENIAASPEAYNRIKDWTTAKELSIRQMRQDSYQIPNTLHFVMMANDQSYCPVFPGDTRITVIEVSDLDPDKLIPKHALLEKLDEEAPYFLWTLLHLELPKTDGRLRLPVIETSRKAESQDLLRSPVELFIRDNCHYVPGVAVSLDQLLQRFLETSPDDHPKGPWNTRRVADAIRNSRRLKDRYPIGDHGTKNVRSVGNIAWEPGEPDLPEMILSGKRLIHRT